MNNNTTANSLFGSPYSMSNPFYNNSNPALDESVANSYAKLEALKKQISQQQLQQLQQTPQQTVFTDIENELKGLSEDEMQFILQSKDYQIVNQKYQNEFSQFLIAKFSSEYLQTGNTRTLEEMLLTIRKEKEKYKDKFAADINEIRDQNKTLLDKNDELSKNNKDLQKQLEEIKNKLWQGGINE